MFFISVGGISSMLLYCWNFGFKWFNHWWNSWWNEVF